MTTKEKILNEALTLFSEKGYTNVFVGEIADAVGIKAPSLYKHFKSKQDIFESILSQMKENYIKKAESLELNGESPVSDADMFSNISEENLVLKTIGLFKYMLHNEYSKKIRKMLTLEQFQNNELATLYTSENFDMPIEYQSAIFGMLMQKGLFISSDNKIMALQFYAPIYTLLTLCDRHPERENQALELLEKHIRQFNKIYTAKEK